MEKQFLIFSGVLGFLGVLLGAFGAHGLRGYLARIDGGVERQQWWETAAHYHLTHALALAVAAYVVSRTHHVAAQVAGIAFMLGIVLFSGSLYTMTLTGFRGLGAVTPLGGLSFLVGWASIAVAAAKGQVLG